MTDQTPEARLAAALRKANRLGFAELRMDNGDRMVPADIDHYVRTYLLSADPALAADLALAAAVRSDDAHLFTVDSLAAAMTKVRPYGSNPGAWAKVAAAAIIEAAKEASG